MSRDTLAARLRDVYDYLDDVALRNEAADALEPVLAPGETWIGTLFDAGRPGYHLVLLPGEFRGSWEEAVAWGEVPTQRELTLIWLNLAAGLRPGLYWSCDECKGLSSFAELVSMASGVPMAYDKRASHWTCAVRRVACA